MGKPLGEIESICPQPPPRLNQLWLIFATMEQALKKCVKSGD
jgi:hypothetical protein